GQMAQRNPNRPGVHLLIAAAALVLPAAAPAADPPERMPAIPLGQVRFVPTGLDGLAQFEIAGDPVAGVLHLGVRPPPASILVTEADQALAPTELDVEDDMLSMTLRVAGAGRLWVVTGTAAERALQVLAVVEPGDEEPPDASAPAATLPDAPLPDAAMTPAA